jgi:hypothetical protein
MGVLAENDLTAKMGRFTNGHLYLFVDWHLAPKGHKKV